MNCPYKGCDSKIDYSTLKYDAKFGRRGKCSKCGRGVTASRSASVKKRLTNSQKRKIRRKQHGSLNMRKGS